MESQPPFGEQLRHYRARAGLTQEALAARVGLAPATIGALERGVRRRPYPSTRRALAEALELAPHERAAFVDLRPAIGAVPESPPPDNLPVSRTPLIGRDREVAALRALVLEESARLVTLTGAGGAGKTCLGLAVARSLRGAFAGGTWLVELAPIADPALLPSALAAALGTQEVAGAPPLDAVLVRLRARPTLLVLDNCEHLIDAVAALTDRLLAACSDLHVLATSREPLQLAGECQWRVPTLAAPAPDGGELSPADLASYPAVELFLARAQAAMPAFRLTAENAKAIAGICDRLDGLPLALELAAARMRVLAPAQILARLDDALVLLVGSSRAAPTRQQTLRATLDWSFALLTPAERAAFARMAIFAGSCDLSAAEEICCGPELAPAEVLDALTRLVDKSLVHVQPGDRSVRYRLLEPVRQYAAHHLSLTGEADEVGTRHLTHYLHLAEQAAPELRGSDQLAWLDRLDDEQGNLRAALGWAEMRGEAAGGLRLAVALGFYWEGRSHLSEGRGWLASMLALPAASAVPAALRARALLAAGRLAQWQSQLEEAAPLLEASLTLARSLNDPLVAAEALAHLGAVRRRQDAFDESGRLLAESLALARATADDASIALALVTLGVTARYQGDHDRSAALLSEGLAHFRRRGDVRWIAIAETMLGYTVLLQGDLIRGERLIRTGLAGHLAVGDRAFCIQGLADLAMAQAARGRPAHAARLLGAMEALAAALGVPRVPANRRGVERLVATVRGRLGATAYERAWASGHTRPLEEVLAEDSPR